MRLSVLIKCLMLGPSLFHKSSFISGYIATIATSCNVLFTTYICETHTPGILSVDFSLHPKGSARIFIILPKWRRQVSVYPSFVISDYILFRWCLSFDSAASSVPYIFIYFTTILIQQHLQLYIQKLTTILIFQHLQLHPYVLSMFPT